MISEKMVSAINDQIKAEFDSAFIYLGMSAWFEEANLSGMATWMRKQYHEEVEHAEKFMKYLYDRGAKVVVPNIDKPADKYESPLAVFKEAYKHECYVTGRICKLMDLAAEEKDYATQSMLKWFIDEQVEEEAQTDEIVKKLEFIGTSHQPIYMLNKELGSRE